MPELPDLEAIKDVLQRRCLGQTVREVRVLRPTVLRILQPARTAESYLAGATLQEFGRRAKLLLIGLGARGWCAIHLMYWGRLRLCPADQAVRVRDYLSLELDNNLALRYHDLRGMGKIYLTTDLTLIPGWQEYGPEPLDPTFTGEQFCQSVRNQTKEIKGILTSGEIVAGIGNAYADEILFAAGIYPFRKASNLTPDECLALYQAMRSVLNEAIHATRERMGDDIEAEVRENMKVHRRGGQACFKCGQFISQEEIGGRITSFCHTCQPGSPIRRVSRRSI
ncbi:MAG: Fpg/Nei family DNA glycosylase [Anaerolineae bacterium]